MKSISARDSRAPAPSSTAKRAPRDLRRAFEVEDPQIGTEIPVRFRLEVEAPRLADAPDFAVVCSAGSHRHARVRQVRHGQQHALPLALERLELGVELLDALRPLAVGVEERRGVLALPLEARHFVAGGILLRASVLRPRG